MQHTDQWKPYKIRWIPAKQTWVVDRATVSPGSWYLVSLMAGPYTELIKSYAQGRLLDLGCGPVPYWPIYRELVTENYCVDWSDSLHENVHLDLAADLNQAIPLPDQSFDTILCTDVLEHIHQPQQLLEEMARLLKPGGKALITTPFLYRVHEEPHD